MNNAPMATVATQRRHPVQALRKRLATSFENAHLLDSILFEVDRLEVSIAGGFGSAARSARALRRDLQSTDHPAPSQWPFVIMVGECRGMNPAP